MTEDIRTRARLWDEQFEGLKDVELLTHPEFRIPEYEDQVSGAGDALGTSMAGTGIITSVVKYVAEDRDPDYDIPDPDWDGQKFAENDILYSKIFEQAERQDSPYDRALLDAIVASENEAQFNNAFQIYKRDLATLEAMNENPAASIFGIFLGIVPDVAATMLAPGFGAGGIYAAGARVTGAGIIAKTMPAARAMGAARIAGFGAAEGFLSTAAEDLNRTMLTDDYVWNTMIGFGVGGLLGGAFPKAIGRIGYDSAKWRSGEVTMLPVEEAHAAARKQSEVVDSGDAGAMRTPNEAQEIVELEIRKSASLGLGLMNRVFKKTFTRGVGLTSPKTTITEYFELAKSLKGTPLGNAMSRVANVTARMFSPNMTFVHNEAGKGRILNAVDIFNDMDADRTSRLMEVTEQYGQLKDLIKDGYTKLARASAMSDTVNRLNRDAVTHEMPSQEDMWRLGDQKAYADRLNAERAVQAPTTDAVATPEAQVSRETIFASVPKMNTIPEELKDQVWDIISDIAEKDNAFYKDLDDRLKKGDILGEDDSIENYRGQIWDTDKVAVNGARFRNMLYRVLAKEPDQDWVNANFAGEIDEAGITKGQFWLDGESWSDASARNPRVADDILDDWGHKVKLAKINDLRGRKDGLESLLEDYAVSDIAGLESKFSGQIDKLAENIMKNEKKIERLRVKNSPDPGTAAGRRGTAALYSAESDAARRVMARQQNKMMQIEMTMEKLSDAFDDLSELKRLQKTHRTPNRPASKTFKSATDKLRKTDRAISDAEASKTIDEVIREMHTSMGSGQGARLSDLPMDRGREGGSRLLKRQLNLGDEQFGEDAAFFLSKNPEKKMLQYVHSVGRRLARTEATVPYIKHHRPNFTSDGGVGDIDALNGLINDAFEEAKKLETDPKMIRKINKEQVKARRFMEEQMIVWNNIGPNDPRLNGVLEVILNGTAMTSLSTVVITQATDVPTAMFALTKGKSGKFAKSLISGLFHTKHKKELMSALEEMKGKDYLMYSAARGLNANDTMRWEKIADVQDGADDIRDIAIGGNAGALGLTRSIFREGGKIQAYATLAPTWNGWVQSSFGHVFLEGMNDGILNFDKLSKIDKDHYARLGLGETQMRKMAKLLNDPKMTVSFGPKGGMLRIPNKELWPEDLYGDFLGTLRRAQNEALIAPELGDMPSFVKRHPLARLIYQFSSFAFAWSGQVMRNQIQQGILHPRDMKNYGTFLMSLVFGAMVMYLKNIVVYDKTHEEMLAKPNVDLMWDILSRTPFVTGMGNSLIEAGTTLVGPPINNAFGASVLPGGDNRFKGGQGAMGGLGPAGGIAGSIIKRLGHAADQDYEKALARSMAAVPLLNVAALRPLINYATDDE
jgi:hypothetical protein